MLLIQKLSVREQAEKYVNQTGIDIAKRSNHYLTALRHCRCGTCFCCEVKNVVDNEAAGIAGHIYNEGG